MKILEESAKTSRPEKVFRWKNGSYIFDPKAVHNFDKKGNPIICYVRQIATPKGAILPIEIPEGYVISAGLLDTVFHRGEIVSVVKGAWASKPKLDWTQMLLYLGLGGTIGYIICLVVNHVSGV